MEVQTDLAVKKTATKKELTQIGLDSVLKMVSKKIEAEKKPLGIACDLMCHI